MMSSKKIKFLRNYINVIQKIKIYLAWNAYNVIYFFFK